MTLEKLEVKVSMNGIARRPIFLPRHFAETDRVPPPLHDEYSRQQWWAEDIEQQQQKRQSMSSTGNSSAKCKNIFNVLKKIL